MKGVIGIDEVGRGPVAGPVTLCAVYIEDPNIIKKIIFNDIIRDSKKVSKINRNNIYLTIRKNRLLKTTVKYAVSSRSANYIDKHGISSAVQSCIVSCLNNLNKKGVDIYKLKINLDAGLKIPIKSIKKQESFVKGDENFTEIALASILAKEHRDRYMKNIAINYSEYFWEENMGYGTQKHRMAIKKFGLTKYHRKSYLKNIIIGLN